MIVENLLFEAAVIFLLILAKFEERLAEQFCGDLTFR